jgi:4-hydroxy-2-oxoglutarate aldolase
MVPSVTPFDEHGTVDFAAIQRNQAHWARSAVVGTLALGSNGEWCSLSDAEALEVVRVVSAGKGDKTLMVGAGRESLHLTLGFIDQLTSVPGIDAVAVLTPHYFADLMSDQALVTYYEDVADRSAFPVFLYVAPKFANGVTLSVQAVAELAEHPNIRGIKESDSGRLAAHLSGGPRPDFSVLAGSVSSLLACLDAGGDGGVVSAANYLPDDCARVAALHVAGDRDRAADELRLLSDIASRTAGAHGVAGVKACMTLRGLDGGFPRRPVLPVAPQAIEQIRSTLTAQGLL